MEDSTPNPDGTAEESVSGRQESLLSPATARPPAGKPLGEASSDSDAWTDDNSDPSSDESDYDSDEFSDYDSNDDSDADITGFGSKQKPSAPRVCTCCKKNEKDLPTLLKHCAKCKRALYCSRECQKSDWKTHKTLCDSGPFNGLPEKVVFAHLIDAYRLRVEDEYVFNGNLSNYTLYGGGDPTRHFQRYLDKAEKRDNALPDWWNKEKRAECERVAKYRDGDTCIYHAVEKSDIIEHYKNPLMPMILRILAEKIYGKGVAAW